MIFFKLSPVVVAFTLLSCYVCAPGIPREISSTPPQCEENCKRCEKDSQGRYKCVECSEGYALNSSDNGTCQKCRNNNYYWVINSDMRNETFCSDTEKIECPKDKPFFVESTKQCVTSCFDDYDCKECRERKFYDNGEGKCIKCQSILKRNSTITNETITEGIVIEQLINYTKEENMTNTVRRIGGSMVSIVIYQNPQCALNYFYKERFGWVDLSNITSEIRKNLSDPQAQLVIAQVEVVRAYMETDEIIGYIISDTTGRVFNLSNIDKNITISYPLVSNPTDLDRKYDPFNPHDSFFNDPCFPYSDKYDNDVLLRDRRKYLFKNRTICEKDCTYGGFDYDNARASCFCPPKNHPFYKVTEKKKAEPFDPVEANGPYFLKCSGVIFTDDSFVSNFGVYYMFLMVFVDLGFLIGFCATSYGNVYEFLESQEALKLGTEGDGLKDNTVSKVELAISEDINKDDTGSSSSRNLKNSSDTGLKGNPPLFDRKKVDEAISRLEDDSPTHRKPKSIRRLPLAEIKEEKDTLHTEVYEYKEDEINDLPLKEAVKLDTRSVKEFFIFGIRSTIIPLKICYKIYKFESICFKALSFIMYISGIMVFNALIFDTKYTSERFLREVSATTSFGRFALIRVFYSALVAFVFNILIGFFPSRKTFNYLNYSTKTKDEYVKSLERPVLIMKIKGGLFILLNIVLTCFFWYSFSTFCGVLVQTQGVILLCSLLCFIFVSAMQCLFILILSILRKLSLKYKLNFLYSIVIFFV